MRLARLALAVLAPALLLTPTLALGQQGTVRYKHTVKIDVQLPPEMEHMRDQIPTERTTAELLYFDEAASLMKRDPQQDEEAESRGRGMRMRFGGRPADDAVYTDFDAGRRLEKRDFMGRTFLITDEAGPLPWRLTGEQSEFLGFLCQKAVATRDTVTVEAWFTPEVPVPAGPGVYGGLPGLVLVVSEDGGRRSYVAERVTLEPPPEGTIAAPAKGREVTREEFDALVEEKMKEMGGMRRGGGFVIRG